MQTFGWVSQGYATASAGIAATKARGVHLGRPIKKPPENFTEVVKQWERGEITFAESLTQTGLKQATFYNRLREFRGGNKEIRTTVRCTFL